MGNLVWQDVERRSGRGPVCDRRTRLSVGGRSRQKSSISHEASISVVRKGISREFLGNFSRQVKSCGWGAERKFILGGGRV